MFVREVSGRRIPRWDRFTAVARAKGVSVGNGKGYNHLLAANAMPSQREFGLLL